MRYLPLKQNYFLGYRTFKTLRNREAWEVANKSFGKSMIAIGGLFLLMSIVSWAIFPIQFKRLMLGAFILVILAVIKTEIELRKIK
ncbi:MAG: SdpI family protein [candidate division WOR-3 bacterium]